MDSGLAGKRFLVTGASGGIGTAIARVFGGEGAAPVLHYHRNQAGAQALARSLEAAPLVVQADLTQEADVERMYGEVFASGAGLDGIVVNAGIWEGRSTPLHEMSLGQWRNTLEADLTSAFLTCRGYFRWLAGAGREAASVVIIGSTAGIFGEAGHADYAAAKAGLGYGLTRTLKNEIVRLAPRGRVNAVCPGWVRTAMAEEALRDPALVKRVTATMALAKVASPEDVGRAVVVLSSERLSGHVSGAVLEVAGGMEGRLLHV